MSDRVLILILCIAEVLGMLGISSFAALLPEMQAEWGLNNADAGWITGIYFAGYLVAVPVLVGLTDRMDPRGIYLASAALGGASLLGFALIADGFWSGLLFRTLSGVALAGTYMPGLKALTDRVAENIRPRAVAFYTASFGIGGSLSFLISGEVAAAWSWQAAFAVVALGTPFSMALAGYAMTARRGVTHAKPETHLLDFRPVFRNREAMAYISAYTAHNFELFGFRGWIVAFLVFSQSLQPDYASWNVILIVTVITLIAVPASVIGGELAMRYGRRRLLFTVMTASAIIAASIGFTGAFPFPLVVGLAILYGLFISADSAAITTGAINAAPPGGRGAVMAVHSSIGFMGSFLGPLAFGVVLDAAGADHLWGWGLAFAAMGAGVIMGPVALALLGARPKTN
ncbi:MAG: MFS transporter [Proteobacteria bacterium]|nr:MFS transporter [Pseudomonadota bacterium]